MKTAILTTLAVAIFLTQLAPSTCNVHKLCRQIHTVTPCTEKRYRVPQIPYRMCTFHMCGAKMVKANACPNGPAQATHECKVFTGRRRTWVCTDPRVLRKINLPIGCVGNACREVIACRCSRRTNVDRDVLSAIRAIPAPRCRPAATQ